jgi:phenylacetate-CoA ligase
MKIFKKVPKKIILVLKVIVTTALCLLIVWKVDWANIWSSLKTANLYWIIAAFLIMVFNVFLSAYKWKILLAVHNIIFSFSQLSKFYFIGSFINNFLPSTIGGDSYRVFKTFPDDKSKIGSYLAVIMDRVTGLFFLTLMGVIGALIAFINDGDKLSEYFLVSGVGILFILMLGFIIIKFKGLKLRKLTVRYLPEKIRNISKVIDDYKGESFNIFLIAFISILFNILLVFSRVLMLFSVNQSCSFLDVVIVIAASNIISLLPITINGLGLRDGTFVYLLTYYGVSYEPAVIVAVLIRVLNIPLSLIGGIYYLRDKQSVEKKGSSIEEIQVYSHSKLPKVNWRKPLLNGIFYLQRNPIPYELKLLRSVEYKSPEYIRSLQEERLKNLLLHTWKNTEYYKQVLEESSVVRNGVVNLERFEDIPILTKDIIKREGDRLKAQNLPSYRKVYKNSSGGSTGKPLEFFQDTHYWNLNIASKIYRFETLGKKLGEKEMKIWGSLDDLLKGTEGVKIKFHNFLYNRKSVQCYQLNEVIINNIINEVNNFKPKLIWVFIDQMHIIAKYINENKIQVHKPVAIFAGATKVYDHARRDIEEAFGVPVIDFYGSRELGDVACECEKRKGLHIASLFNKVEVIDKNNNPVIGQEGDLVITSLMNYAMPFIRYRIGDRGKLTDRICSCGRGFPMIESISGRTMEMFFKSNGEILHPLLFINIIKEGFNINQIEKFQLVQEDYNRIVVKLVIENGIEMPLQQPVYSSVKEKIKNIMGAECEVVFDRVDSIPLTKHGKHLYTVCNLKNNLIENY